MSSRLTLLCVLTLQATAAFADRAATPQECFGVVSDEEPCRGVVESNNRPGSLVPADNDPAGDRRVAIGLLLAAVPAAALGGVALWLAIRGIAPASVSDCYNWSPDEQDQCIASRQLEHGIQSVLFTAVTIIGAAANIGSAIAFGVVGARLIARAHQMILVPSVGKDSLGLTAVISF